MTPNERFALLLVVISVVGTGTVTSILYLGKRMFDRFDTANADRQQMIIQAADERQAANDRHASRNAEQITILTNVVASNQTKLTDLYAEMSTRIARIEGKLNVPA